jgi:hypothetical protein
MHYLFKQLIEDNTPQMNRDVCDGLACYYMDKVEEYIDAVFKSAAKSFIPGLEYTGEYERCTPQEEYIEATRPKNNKRVYDIATSYVYMVKYKFTYEGIELPPRYIYLPYVTDGGLIYLSGTLYHISPVITDNVISPAYNSVFIRLLRDRIVFERSYHSVVVDNVKETTHVAWANIYKMSKAIKKVPPTTKAKPTAIHYLLAKYGFSEMFRKYLGFVPVIGESEITLAKYPADKWIICQSIELQPRSWQGDYYNPTHIRLAIPRERWNPDTLAFVTGFFYVVDYFPDRIKIAYIDNKNRWMILLGHVIFSGMYGDGKLYDLIKEHFESLDECVDSIVIHKLAEIGYNIENFYDLLALIVTNFNKWAVNAAESNMSLYGKSLEILYYVMFDITSAIFKTIFKLNKAATKKKLIAKEIVKIMNRHLKTGPIFGLTRGNIAISTVSYSGDNKYPKITSILGIQQSAAGATRGKSTRTVVDSTKRLHVSSIEAGSILYLSKSNPTPNSKANPFMEVNLSNSKIVAKEEYKELLEHTENLLKGKLKPED